MASLPQPPLPVQNHQFITQENQKSNLCPSKALCQLPCKDIPQAHSFLAPDDVYCKLIATKDLHFFGHFLRKTFWRKPTFLFGTNRSQRCILLFSSLNKNHKVYQSLDPNNASKNHDFCMCSPADPLFNNSTNLKWNKVLILFTKTRLSPFVINITTYIPVSPYT